MNYKIGMIRILLYGYYQIFSERTKFHLELITLMKYLEEKQLS